MFVQTLVVSTMLETIFAVLVQALIFSIIHPDHSLAGLAMSFTQDSTTAHPVLTVMNYLANLTGKLHVIRVSSATQVI